MSFGSPQPTPAIIPPAMEAPAPPPAFGQSPVGQKATRKPTQATFLGSAFLPGPGSSNFGGKTLLGT